VDFAIVDTTHFDNKNRVFSEQRLTIPREQLSPDVTLDTTLAYRLAALYFALLERAWGPVINVEIDAGEIHLATPGRGVTLSFGVGVPDVSETCAAIRWPIIGGRALDKGTDDGGTFSVGAEWDEARANLTVFSRIEGYPPSLPRWAYSLMQQRVHKFFTHRFLKETVLKLSGDVILSERSERRISFFGANMEILRRFAPQNDGEMDF